MPHQTPSFPPPQAKPPVSVLPIHHNWQTAASANGFEIIRRCADPAYVELKCQTCGRAHQKRHSVILGSTPVCPHCVQNRWREVAAAAELDWLGRDPQDPKRGRYRAPCGHEVSRQFELIKRIAGGACALRCETCQRAKEEAEATAAGWTLLGPAHEHGVNYRLYRHECGHEQEIARMNMRTERLICAGCGIGWSASPSFIYCMRFQLPGLPALVKLGFSRNPKSRMKWQLLRRPDLSEHAQPSGQILRSIQIRTGHLALCLEKKMHAALRRSHPGSVVPPQHYRPWLKVKSEIYTANLEPVILDLLDRLDPGTPAPD